MELQLARHHLQHEDDARALAIANAVIERCGGKSDLAMALADALELRWRLTDSVDDFVAAKRELESFDDPEAKRQLAVMLIDHGDFEEADKLLGDERREGDFVANLLVIDIRLRTNRGDDARELLRAISEDRITERSRLPYAYTAGLVALNTNDSELRTSAASMLRSIAADEGELPPPVQTMLEALEAGPTKQTSWNYLLGLSARFTSGGRATAFSKPQSSVNGPDAGPETRSSTPETRANPEDNPPAQS